MFLWFLIHIAKLPSIKSTRSRILDVDGILSLTFRYLFNVESLGDMTGIYFQNILIGREKKKAGRNSVF